MDIDTIKSMLDDKLDPIISDIAELKDTHKALLVVQLSLERKDGEIQRLGDKIEHNIEEDKDIHQQLFDRIYKHQEEHTEALVTNKDTTSDRIWDIVKMLLPWLAAGLLIAGRFEVVK